MPSPDESERVLGPPFESPSAGVAAKMQTADYIILVAYFVGMSAIGFLCMLRVRRQEDFFLGGRAFGRLFQTFAAFGAGTSANDPVTVGRTTYTSGLNGIWGVLYWLFVTPFYWITAVWYRRMRHLTLGDWFTERYQSRSLGAAYAVFGIVFYMAYLSVGFSAVGKVCAPLIGTETVDIAGVGVADVPIERVLVPIIAIVVIIYGVLGGLRAAYWTDLIQGLFIILLSVILIPSGLDALAEKFGGPDASTIDGFRVLHEQLPASFFQILDSPRGGEFPFYYILAITLINLVGIVVQPHFIATGGGSAKSENSARVGLVVGNFLKRLCTVGWALTALIVLALLAGNQEMAEDPDRVWGVAAREILGPFNLGLVGLMLACLLAALMSSADCYMIMSSGLFVRNIYAAYLDRTASEQRYILVGRIVGIVMVLGAALISLSTFNVWDQLKFTWELPMVFAAVFWVGMYWRRATHWAAWITVAFSTLVFFLLPLVLPVAWDDLRRMPELNATNEIVTRVVTRSAAPSDVATRQGEIAAWERKQREIMERNPPGADRNEALAELGERPPPLALGDDLRDVFVSGGKAIFWTKGVKPIGEEKRVVVRREELADGELLVERYDCPLEGQGFFNLDLLLYRFLSIELESMPNAAIEALRLPPKMVTPFLILIFFSVLTPKLRKRELDRYFVKMKTPVHPDPARDREELELSYEKPERFHERKLFPGTQLEIQKPTAADFFGFVICFGVCFGIIWLAVAVASIGG